MFMIVFLFWGQENRTKVVGGSGFTEDGRERGVSEG